MFFLANKRAMHRKYPASGFAWPLIEWYWATNSSIFSLSTQL